MKKRPGLYRGDLVRIHKNSPHYKNYKNTVFKVIRCEAPDRYTRRALDHCAYRGGGYDRTSSDGATIVDVIGKDGVPLSFKRSDIWRIPNQPKDKHRRK